MNKNISEFYKLAETDYKGADGYQHRIFWNVENIAKKPNANGYIVQWIDSYTTSPQIKMEGKAYFEAWQVVDGSTGNIRYDDEFWAGWLDVPGEVTYRAKVFWIDEEDELFSIVDEWEKGAVQMANKLLSAYDFPEIKEREPVCERYFKWNSEDYM